MMIQTTEELQQHIRLIGSNDFDNLKPMLKRAKRYIVRLVGVETWDAAETHYNSEFYTNPHLPPVDPDPDADPPEEPDYDAAKMNELVDRIQDALVHYAYWLYSPQGNVILTDSGYQVAWNENLRPALQWQIDKAVQSLLDTAHEFMDDLIEYLDAEFLDDEDLTFWAGTTEEDKTKELFLNNAREFGNYVNIDDSRRLYLEVRPFIVEAEKVHIVPTLGSEDFATLKEKQKDDELEPADLLVIALVQAALAPLSMAAAITTLPIEIFKGSITEISIAQVGSKRTVTRLELLNAYASRMKEVGMVNLQRLRDHLAELEADPEYLPPTAQPEPVITRKSFGV